MALVPIPVATRNALIGRDAELGAIEELIARASAGQSGTLVLRGEAGIGKTALLKTAAGMAGEMKVLSVSGIEYQSDLAYAGLHGILKPLLHDLAGVPQAQREALARALGMDRAGPTDRFRVALGAMTLISHAAEKDGVLCLVDDAQWLDAESLDAFAFIARRLDRDRVAIICAVRTSERETTALHGIPAIAISRLSHDDSAELLAARCALAPVGGAVRRRLVSEANGNPLALIEFASNLSLQELMGTASLPDALPISKQLEDRFALRIRKLPKRTRKLLLLAAVETQRDDGLFWKAARKLGLTQEDARAAQDAGLLEREPMATFPHPLVRSAVYRSATFTERSQVHDAWAKVLRAISPERSAWHRGQGAAAPDEDVARQLERSAEAARQRGGCASEAQYLERAAELTMDPVKRRRRMLASASVHYQAGELERTARLVRELSGVDDDTEAGATRLKGAIAWSQGRLREACRCFLQAAQTALTHDRSLAQTIYIQAFECAVSIGHLDRTLVREVAQSATQARAKRPTQCLDWLLIGLCQAYTQGIPNALPELRRACSRVIPEGDPLSGRFCDAFAIDLWDERALTRLATWRTSALRDQAALAQLPIALYFEALHCDGLHGNLHSTAIKLDEADSISRAMGLPADMSAGPGGLFLSSWKGDPSTRSRAKALVGQGLSAEIGMDVADALLHLANFEAGSGDFRAAFAAATEVWAKEGNTLLHGVSILPILVDAAVACGDSKTAADAVAELADRTSGCGTKWATGTLLAARARVAEGSEAERLYGQAIEHLGQTGIATALARTHLWFGAWLRRHGRKIDARAHLQAAHTIYLRMGADGFAGRAAEELGAVGHRPDDSQRGARQDLLTLQERRVAEAAAEGLSTVAVAAKLYLSVHTVKFHLKRVFAKLGITSRSQIGAALLRGRAE